MDIYEINKSQSGSNARNRGDSFDRTFGVIAALGVSLFQVEATVRAQLADSEGEMKLTSVDVTEEDRSDDQRFWSVRARYRDPDHPDARQEKETGESEVSFDTTGATATRTHAISQVYYDDDTADEKQDNSLAIEWDGQRANGVDVVIPQLRFQETHYIANDTVRTGEWVINVARATGKVNSEIFRGFGPGELLFLGASGSQRGRGDWQVTFYFSASETISMVEKGAITVRRKEGHQHLWMTYSEQEYRQRLIPVPDKVYVSTIYSEFDFHTLELPEPAV